MVEQLVVVAGINAVAVAARQQHDAGDGDGAAEVDGDGMRVVRGEAGKRVVVKASLPAGFRLSGEGTALGIEEHDFRTPRAGGQRQSPITERAGRVGFSEGDCGRHVHGGQKGVRRGECRTSVGLHDGLLQLAEVFGQQFVGGIFSYEADRKPSSGVRSKSFHLAGEVHTNGIMNWREPFFLEAGGKTKYAPGDVAETSALFVESADGDRLPFKAVECAEVGVFRSAGQFGQ